MLGSHGGSDRLCTVQLQRFSLLEHVLAFCWALSHRLS